MPTIYPDDQLPGLPPYPWHLINQGRVNQEMARLHEEALFTSIVLWNASEAPPLEICFMTARMGADRVLIIVTPWNYPEEPPTARVAPFVQMGAEDDLYDVFEELWAKSEPVDDPPDWHWSDEHYLVDYIRVLEQSLGIKAEPKPQPDPPQDDPDDEALAYSPADGDPASSEEDAS